MKQIKRKLSNALEIETTAISLQANSRRFIQKNTLCEKIALTVTISSILEEKKDEQERKSCS